MAISDEDLAVIEGVLDDKTADDLPPPPPPPRVLSPITSAVVNFVWNQLLDPGGMHSVGALIAWAREHHPDKRWSAEQVRTVLNAVRARIAELQTPEELPVDPEESPVDPEEPPIEE